MLSALSHVCIQEAEGLYKTMVKRFRQDKAVWLSYGTFLLQQGQSDAASVLLQRALKSLPSKESKMACPNAEDVVWCIFIFLNGTPTIDENKLSMRECRFGFPVPAVYQHRL